MQSKKLLVALIATLMLLLTGCGTSTSNSSKESSPPKEIQEIEKNEPSRFSSETVTIPGIDTEINFSYIITDHRTGKQYLYIQGYGHRVTMVELGTIDDIYTDTNK